jgi:hypothetical protein
MTTPKTGKNLGGRPSREETERKRLATIGIDPASIDVRRILASIAADTKAPAAVRLGAVRDLQGKADMPAAAAPPDDGHDELSRRALTILIQRTDEEDDDVIPSIGAYRDVPLHDNQDEKRLECVRRNIDFAMKLTDLEDLCAFCENGGNAPESRLLAFARIKAIWAMAVDRREARPDVDLKRLNAIVSPLESVEWRCDTHFGSLLDKCPGAVRRETPISPKDR